MYLKKQMIKRNIQRLVAGLVPIPQQKQVLGQVG